MTEWNLSEKRQELTDWLLLRVSVKHGDWESFEKAIEVQDKEFIRLLKEETMHNAPNSLISVHDIIDKLAGEKLVK